MDIEKMLIADSRIITVSRPSIFNLAGEADRLQLATLYESGAIKHVIDDYPEQLRELFQIDNPTLVFDPGFESALESHVQSLRRDTADENLVKHGRWVYFPWNNTIVHILEDISFQRVRTARNRDLIKEEEQHKFYDATIGICGLSVGNSVALSIVLQGGAKRIRLADFDRLGLSNLNRIRAGIESLGLSKVEMTARQIYALNPYAEVELFPEGITQDSIQRFFEGPPALDVIIDELDNLAAKLLIRQEASKHSVPVVMGADNGDNAVIDIERYDEDARLPYFHGRLGDVSYDELKNLDKFGIGRTITKHIGPENITQRMQESLLAMGKTIVSWPQLGGAALINGAAVAYCVRKILISEPLESNRALVSVDEKMIPDYSSPEQSAVRAESSGRFAKIFKLSE